MWSQRIQFTPEEEAILAASEARFIAAGGVEHLTWTAEDEAVIDAACAQLRAEWEAPANRALEHLRIQEEQVLMALRQTRRASRRKRMVLDAVRRSAHLR